MVLPLRVNSSFNVEFGQSFLDGAALAARAAGVGNRCPISFSHSTMAMKPSPDGSFNIGGHSFMQSMSLGASVTIYLQRTNTTSPKLGNTVAMYTGAHSTASAENSLNLELFMVLRDHHHQDCCSEVLIRAKR